MYWISRRNGGFREGHPDGAGRLFAALLQPHPVIGLASGSVAGDFAINVDPACFRLLHFFENEEPRAFRNHETVAVAGEGPRSAPGLIVPAGTHNPHELKTAHDQGSDEIRRAS